MKTLFIRDKMKKTMLSIFAICFSLFSCDLLNSSDPDTTNHKMYVFSNTAQKFYVIDYRTFRVVKEISLQMPFNVNEDLTGLRFMTLSTDRSRLFFEATGTWPDPSLGFAVYDLGKEKFQVCSIPNSSVPARPGSSLHRINPSRD